MTIAATSALPRVPCAGVPVVASSRAGAARELLRLATSELDRGIDVHFVNAYTLALADQDHSLRLVLRESTLNLPDGVPLVWVNRWRHRRQALTHERLYGPDLMGDLFELGQDVGLRHYLLGSTPEVLDSLERELCRRYPRATIVGVESPPFRPLSGEEAEQQLRRITLSDAQVVWVGLGTPTQDWEAARLAGRLPLLVTAVGAAFDFIAGTKKQAPRWVQRSGLEWAFRLATEPRRLWRRYLFGNTRFVRAMGRAERCLPAGPYGDS